MPRAGGKESAVCEGCAQEAHGRLWAVTCWYKFNHKLGSWARTAPISMVGTPHLEEATTVRSLNWELERDAHR